MLLGSHTEWDSSHRHSQARAVWVVEASAEGSHAIQQEREVVRGGSGVHQGSGPGEGWKDASTLVSYHSADFAPQHLQTRGPSQE